MNMIERAARALWQEVGAQTRGHWPVDVGGQDDGNGLVDAGLDFPALARAVILSLREPSEGMDDIGWDKLDYGPIAVWQAMIDAALAE